MRKYQMDPMNNILYKAQQQLKELELKALQLDDEIKAKREAFEKELKGGLEVKISDRLCLQPLFFCSKNICVCSICCRKATEAVGGG